MDLLQLWQTIHREAAELAETVGRLPDHCECGHADSHLEGRCRCCNAHEDEPHAGGVSCAALLNRLQADLAMLSEDLALAGPPTEAAALEKQRFELRRGVFLAAELIERVEEDEVLIYPVGMFESRGKRSRGLLKLIVGDDYTEPELKRIAEATGGRAHFPGNVEECRQAMKEIAREVSQQYSLGYYPTTTARDGKWRAIQVAVGQEPAKPAYVARTRAGYYGPKAGDPK